MSTDTHIRGTPTRSTPPDNTRWTGEKAGDFLKSLARTGKVASAARAVGMSRQAAYRLRERAPRFAGLWEVALEQARRQRASARRGKRVHPLLDPRPVADDCGALRG